MSLLFPIRWIRAKMCLSLSPGWFKSQRSSWRVVVEQAFLRCQIISQYILNIQSQFLRLSGNVTLLLLSSVLFNNLNLIYIISFSHNPLSFNLNSPVKYSLTSTFFPLTLIPFSISSNDTYFSYTPMLFPLASDSLKGMELYLFFCRAKPYHIRRNLFPLCPQLLKSCSPFQALLPVEIMKQVEGSRWLYQEKSLSSQNSWLMGREGESQSLRQRVVYFSGGFYFDLRAWILESNVYQSQDYSSESLSQESSL